MSTGPHSDHAATDGFRIRRANADAVARKGGWFLAEHLAGAERGERIVLVAEDTDSQTIIGTVQLALAMSIITINTMRSLIISLGLDDQDCPARRIVIRR